MDLKFDWWFLPLFSLFPVIGLFILLILYLFVFGFIFLFSYFISRLFLELIEALFKWQPLMEERSKRRLVISLAILMSVAFFWHLLGSEIKKIPDFLMILHEMLSALIKYYFH